MPQRILSQRGEPIAAGSCEEELIGQHLQLELFSSPTYLAGQNTGRPMKRYFTAVIKQDGGWWIGWVAEIPGVNSQGKTRPELMKNLRSALKEALEFNRADALSAAKSDYEEEPILV